ncbi:MAG: UDP-N-acetylglucosamine 1-carboxyvinyltransferase [Candidatus Margulisiibacteriota bacterium]
MSTTLTVVGGAPLVGTVKAAGAKNSALPLLAACILMDGTFELSNVPYLHDVATMIRMLNALGLRAEYSADKVKITNNKKVRHIAPYELITAMRASFFVAGPILAKTGYAKVPLPGGCSIGSRPVDLHIKGFRALGAQVNIEHGFVDIKASKLKGTKIYLDFPSVGATENVMMAAALAEGTSVIENAAMEPEITDLGDFLNKAGAKITGHGTPNIVVEGVPSLTGANHEVIPDRVEAGTLMIAGGITKGDVLVTHVSIPDLEPLIEKLKEAGLKVEVGDRQVRVAYQGSLNAVNFETLPFPGFPTDMQAQMMALLTVAKGTSVVKEGIFENRFMHAPELMRMGASIKLDMQYAFVTGVEKLSGAEVKITDLRAGAALILAGLAADGETKVHGLNHLRRGYDRLPEKLQSLGATIVEHHTQGRG